MDKHEIDRMTLNMVTSLYSIYLLDNYELNTHTFFAVLYDPGNLYNLLLCFLLKC